MKPMLIPRFSLRTTLMGVTASAFFFVIFGFAMRGHAWAVGITAAVVSVLAAFVIHAYFFVVVSWLGHLMGAKLSPARTSQGGLQTSTDELTAVAPKNSTEPEAGPSAN